MQQYRFVEILLNNVCMYIAIIKEEKFVISLPHDTKVLQKLASTRNNAVVCITTQQVLFNANWNDDKFWS